MFIPYSNKDGHVIPWVKVPFGAITPVVGLGVYMSSGVAALATGTQKPEYICMEQHEDAVTSGTEVLCIAVAGDTVYATTNSASFSAINIGDKVTLASDALRVTATTVSGVAEVMYIGGTGIGSEILVKFPD